MSSLGDLGVGGLKGSARMDRSIRMAPASSGDCAAETPAAADPTDEDTAHKLGIDLESYRYWKAVVARMPPMTQEEIEAVARILNRIDERRRLCGTDANSSPAPPAPQPIAVIPSGLPIADIMKRLAEIQAENPNAEVRRGSRNTWEIWPRRSIGDRTPTAPRRRSREMTPPASVLGSTAAG